MASIDDNGSGGEAAYRCSKAALNMMNKCWSCEIPDLKCILFHPGIVGTDLLANSFFGAPKEELLKTNERFQSFKTPEQSAAELIKICVTEEKDRVSGEFYDYAGKEIKW
jgi:NAD(P)-dependent dehydrogenase (short-subunit alcohol dehydrogenase family)